MINDSDYDYNKWIAPSLVTELLKGAYLVNYYHIWKKCEKIQKNVFDFAHIFRSFYLVSETFKSGVFFANSTWKGYTYVTLLLKYRVQVSKGFELLQ